MWDVYKNTNSIILERLQEVKNRLADEQVDVEIQAAANILSMTIWGAGGTKGTTVKFWEQPGFG
jgi:hypothetical protein